LANFEGRRVAMLRTLHDVDTAADLRAHLTTTPSPPPGSSARSSARGQAFRAPRERESWP
jgi:hypothetical protein